MKLCRAIAMVMATILLVLAAPTYSASADTLYSIGIDITNQIVTVYSASDGSIVRQMICSAGADNKYTPRGTYSMPKKRMPNERGLWYKLIGCYGHYATRVYEGIMFHSYLYNATRESSVDEKSINLLGVPVSHGCIRLEIPDAKWIAENCFAGTKVRIYESGTRTDYLKEKLYRNSFAIEDGIAYEAFVGGATGDEELGYMSTGEHVRSLQGRLLGLGLYTGELNGVYNDVLVDAIETLQQALGLTVNGKVNKGLWTLLFSEEAPTSDLSNLCAGANGPNVRYVQALLKKLGLYNGEINGVFGAATDDATRKFQKYIGATANGMVTLELRARMEEAIVQLAAQYPSGYALKSSSEEKTLATIATASNIKLNVRESASKQAKSLGQLKSGTVVEVVSSQDDWSQIEYQGNRGYVLREYLNTYTETVFGYGFMEQASAQQMEFDPSAYKPALFFPVKTVKLAKGSKSANMIFYKSESKKKVAFALLERSVVDIVERGDKWTLATYCGVEGYIPTSHLTAVDVETISATSDSEPVMARNVGDEVVNVFSNVSTNSDIIGALNSGDKTEVLKQGETWSQIAYGEGVGYVENEGLQIGAVSEAMEQYVSSVSHLLATTGPIDGTSTTAGKSELATDIANSDVVPEADFDTDVSDGLDDETTEE